MQRRGPVAWALSPTASESADLSSGSVAVQGARRRLYTEGFGSFDSDGSSRDIVVGVVNLGPPDFDGDDSLEMAEIEVELSLVDATGDRDGGADDGGASDGGASDGGSPSGGGADERKGGSSAVGTAGMGGWPLGVGLVGLRRRQRSPLRLRTAPGTPERQGRCYTRLVPG